MYILLFCMCRTSIAFRKRLWWVSPFNIMSFDIVMWHKTYTIYMYVLLLYMCITIFIHIMFIAHTLIIILKPYRLQLHMNDFLLLTKKKNGDELWYVYYIVYVILYVQSLSTKSIWSLLIFRKFTFVTVNIADPQKRIPNIPICLQCI